MWFLWYIFFDVSGICRLEQLREASSSPPALCSGLGAEVGADLPQDGLLGGDRAVGRRAGGASGVEHYGNVRQPDGLRLGPLDHPLPPLLQTVANKVCLKTFRSETQKHREPMGYH